MCVYGCLWISDSSIVLLFCIKLRGGKPKLYKFMLIVWITLYNMYFNVFSINLKIKFFFYKFHAHHNHVAYEIVGLSSCQTRSLVYYMYICNGSLVEVKLIVIYNIYMYGFDYMNNCSLERYIYFTILC